MAKGENKQLMAIWNEKLSVKEKADKAIKNLIKAEEELKALIEWGNKEEKKTLTEENLNKAKEGNSYKVYRNEIYKKALVGFGISKSEAEVTINKDLDIFDEDE